MEEPTTTAASTGETAALAAWIAAQQLVLGRHAGAEAKRLRPKAVHQLRVALRRLLTALSLSDALGVEHDQKTWRRLRKLLSLLSPARDAHVQQRSLAEHLPRHGGTELLLAELRRRRRAATKRARKGLRRFDHARVDRALSAVSAALRTMTADRSVVRAALLGQLASQHLIVQTQLQGASGDDPAALHALRVAIKSYRYALEALAPVLPSTQALARRCEELQNLLGGAHDAHVLAQSAADLAERQHDPTAAGLAQELRSRSERQHEGAAAALARTQLPWLAGDA